MGWGELGMQRDEGLMNVANTRARRLFIHFYSNKISGSGASVLPNLLGWGELGMQETKDS